MLVAVEVDVRIWGLWTGLVKCILAMTLGSGDY